MSDEFSKQFSNRLTAAVHSKISYEQTHLQHELRDIKQHAREENQLSSTIFEIALLKPCMHIITKGNQIIWEECSEILEGNVFFVLSVDENEIFKVISKISSDLLDWCKAEFKLISNKEAHAIEVLKALNALHEREIVAIAINLSNLFAKARGIL